MNSYILLIILLLITIIMAAILLYFAKNIKLYNILIFIALFVFWLSMYIFKNDVSNKVGFGSWIWPLVASLYQFFQVIFRIPLGILSQKLKSRKKVIQIAASINLLGLIIVVSTQFSIASIVIASACTGVYGATFGLDSQYWSENHNIKKVFLSSAMIFTIPVIASFIASLIHDLVPLTTDLNRTYILASAISLSLLSIIVYGFMKERVETIGLDNMDPNAKPWVDKGFKDIFAISTAAAGAAFAYNSIIVFAHSHLGIFSYLVDFLSLLASVVTALFIVKKVSFFWIRSICMMLLLIAGVVIWFEGVQSELSNNVWITTSVFASVAFGSYVMSLFGATLHFDHKFPALVLGIFLTVKSFALGASTLIGGEIKVAAENSSDESYWVGLAVLVTTIFGLAISQLGSFYFLIRNKKRKFKDVSILVKSAQKFESISSKMVNSNKNV